MIEAAGRLSAQLASRIALSFVVLVISGLLAAALVRVSPGFGMDERLLDSRYSSDSRKAIEMETAGQSDIFSFYRDYLGKLAHGDLGTSVSLRRPVKELLLERLTVSLRAGAVALALAWSLSLVLAGAMLLTRLKLGDWIASFATGTLLCVPAALLAVVAAYIGAPPAIAIAAVLFPRIFRYVRNLARQASGAPHVLAAHALGLSKVRILRYHVVTPILPELLALAGASVSMAVAALIPVEALCDSPGVGQLIWQAALARDVPVLVNVTLLIAGLTIAANLLADTARAARQAAI